MALNYDEAIAELRGEEKRLEEELAQVRAAIPAMIMLRNRNASKGEPAVQFGSARLLPGIGRYAGMGATAAIPALLKQAATPLASGEIVDLLKAGGWTTNAKKPVGVVSATLISLENKGFVERVGERWRTRDSIPRVPFHHEAFSTERSQPSPQ